MSDKQVKRHEDLNKVASEALKGMHLNPARHLADLLESNAPIDLEVRVLLAMSLRGTNPFGVILDVSGHEESARRLDSLTKKRRDYRIGKIVEQIAIELGPTKAFVEAVRRWGRDESFYRKPYYYAQKCDNWVRSARLEGGIYEEIDIKHMQDIWHHASIGKYDPPNSAEYLQDRAWRLKCLNESVGKNGFSDEDAAEAMILWEYLEPKPF